MWSPYVAAGERPHSRWYWWCCCCSEAARLVLLVRVYLIRFSEKLFAFSFCFHKKAHQNPQHQAHDVLKPALLTRSQGTSSAPGGIFFLETQEEVRDITVDPCRNLVSGLLSVTYLLACYENCRTTLLYVMENRTVLRLCIPILLS